MPDPFLLEDDLPDEFSPLDEVDSYADDEANDREADEMP